MHDSSQEARTTAFVSYAQTSKRWQQEVLRFTTALRTLGGIDAELDLFHTADHQQWTTFGATLIADSDFTLIAVDGAYRRRWLGEEKKGIGAGAAREAAVVKSIFEKDQTDFVRRVKVVILPSADLSDIPDELRGVCEFFEIKTFDRAGLEDLLRSLWGKPAFPKPPLGEIPTLPPKAVEHLERDSSTEIPRQKIGHEEGLSPVESDTKDETSLRSQLSRVDKQLADSEDEIEKEWLMRERTALEVSLRALSEAHAIAEAAATKLPSRGKRFRELCTR